MGCCSAASSAKPPSKPSAPVPSSKKIAITCEYQGQREVLNTLNLAALRDQLRTRIPALTFKSFRLSLKGKEVTSSEDLRKEVESSGNRVSLAVEIEDGALAQDEAEQQLLPNVLIVAEGAVVLGTGVLVSQELVLCAAEDLERRVQQDGLRLVFPGRTERISRLNKAGVCLELATVGKVQVCLLQLAEPASASPNIRLDQEILSENTLAKCWFVSATQYTRHRPVLQTETLSPLTLKSAQTYLSDKALREGACGAPVVTSLGRLIGLYINAPEESGGLVISANGLLEQLTARIGQLPPLQQSVVSSLLPEPAEEDVNIASYAAPVAASPPQADPSLLNDPPVAPEDVILKSSSLPEPAEEPISLPNPYYSVNLFEGLVVRYDSKGQFLSNIPIPSTLVSGFSAILTPKGLFLTGSDSDSKMRTLLVTESQVEMRQAPRWTHNFHVSLWFLGKALVISGLNTENVERYSFHDDYWNQGPNLPHSRANSSAAVLGGAAYVFGGLGRNLRRYKRSVFKLAGEEWTKLSVRLDLHMRRCGCVPCEDGLIVFGGIVKREGLTSRESVLEVDLKTGKVVEVGRQDLGDFGGACSGEVDGEWLAVSDQGKIYEFLQDARRFRTIRE